MQVAAFYARRSLLRHLSCMDLELVQSNKVDSTKGWSAVWSDHDVKTGAFYTVQLADRYH